MRIYLSHSKNINYKNLYKKFEEIFSNNNFIFPYQNNTEPVDSSKFLKEGNCDLLLAEVSVPSTGQGVEIGWANANKIPIIFFYKKGSDVSRSLRFLSNKIIKYDSLENLFIEFKKYLNE